MTQTTQKLTKKKKQLIFLEALKSTLGNVTAAIRKVKQESHISVGRKTHYNWIEGDAWYEQAVNELPDLEVDFYENALNKLIQSGNPAATIFALKAKGKKRGWIEKTEQSIEHSGQIKTLSAKELYDEIKRERTNNQTGDTE